MAEIKIAPGPWDNCLHQLPTVSAQTDQGVYTLERIYQFLGKVIKLQTEFANSMRVLCDEETKLLSQSRDGITSAWAIYSGMINYYKRTSASQLKVSKTFQTDIRPPIFTDITKINHNESVAQGKESKCEAFKEAHRKKYEAQRENSMHYWDKMRKAVKDVDQNAKRHGSNHDKTAKARAYFQRQVDKASASFKESEELYARSNVARRDIQQTGILEVVRHHQGGEMIRIQRVQAAAQKWFEGHTTIDTVSKKELAPIRQEIKLLEEPIARLSELKESWHKSDPPIPLPDIRLGLPTSSTVIADNAGPLGRMLHEDNLDKLFQAHDRIVHPPPTKLLRTKSGNTTPAPPSASHRRKKSQRTILDLPTLSSCSTLDATQEEKESVIVPQNPSTTERETLDLVIELPTKTSEVKKPPAVRDIRAPSIKDVGDAPEIQYEYVTAQYDFNNPDPNCVNFKRGDLIIVMSKDASGWWRGCVSLGDSWSEEGAFPGNYVKSNY